MSYSAPPFVVANSLSGASPSADAIPAQGAGTRIRVVGGHVSLNRTNTGISNVTFSAAGGIGVFFRGLGLSVPNGAPWMQVQIPEPGIAQDTDNTAVNISLSQSVAGDTVFWVLYYYVDNSS